MATPLKISSRIKPVGSGIAANDDPRNTKDLRDKVVQNNPIETTTESDVTKMSSFRKPANDPIIETKEPVQEVQETKPTEQPKPQQDNYNLAELLRLKNIEDGIIDVDYNTKDITSLLDVSNNNQLEIVSSLDALKTIMELNDVNTEPVQENIINPLPDVKKDVDVIPKEDQEIKDKKVSDDNSKHFEKLTGAVNSGFKSSISMADQVVGFLFKMSMTAILNAAKLALAVFAIIVAIDVITINVKYMIGLLKSSFEDFNDMFGTWSGLFGNIALGIEKLWNAWEDGDFFEAFIEVLISNLRTIAASLLLGIGKMVSAVLKALNFKETGDDIEGIALQHYQKETDAKLNDKDATKLAEYQVRQQEKDGLVPSERGITSRMPSIMRMAMGFLDNDDVNKIIAEKKSSDQMSGLSDDQKIKTTMAINQANAAIGRLDRQQDATDLTKDSNIKRLEKTQTEVKQLLESKDIELVPIVKKELGDRLEKINKNIELGKQGIKPQDVKESAESRQAKTIEQATNKETKASQAKNAISNTITQVNQASSNFVQQAITGVVIPGIIGLAKMVN